MGAIARNTLIWSGDAMRVLLTIGENKLEMLGDGNSLIQSLNGKDCCRGGSFCSSLVI